MLYTERIESLLMSFCSLFYLGSPNHRLMVTRCTEIAARHSMELLGYNISDGITRNGKPRPGGEADPLAVLDKIIALGHQPVTRRRKLFFLEHFDLVLEGRDPLVLTKLRLIHDSSCAGYTVVLTGRPHFHLPEIISDIPVIDVPALDDDDLDGLVDACGADLSDHETKGVVEELKGLTQLECENLLSLSLALKKRPDPAFIRDEKAALLARKSQGFLELCRPSADFSDVGGLDALKAWLVQRGRVFHSNETDPGYPLPRPKGVLLTGPPGCGKSFVITALAGTWGVKLVKLSASRLFSSFVGRTEQNLRFALETVGALTPCIFWIDEFEKFFPRTGGSDSDGGVLARVLGVFLDFLHGERGGIFVCGTTNRLQELPEEIMRTGRFDAVFFVDLPNRDERSAILEVLFRKYGIQDKVTVSGTLLDTTQGFSAAELEQAVLDMLYENIHPGKKLEWSLLRKIREIIPLALTMEENIGQARAWCAARLRPASRPQKTHQDERRSLCRISPR